MRYPKHFPDEHPDDPRTYVPNIEFYITNVCNLTCSNCNRFNNHAFTGYQKWSDYEAEYTAWAEKIRLQRVTILGGEPLLNPTICDWVNGINRLWNKTVQILTNGVRINHVPGLYDVLNNYTGSHNEEKNWIGVSVHNENDLDRHLEEGKKFLQGSGVRQLSKAEITNDSHYALTDNNHVALHYWLQDEFYTSAVQKNANGKFTLFQNDPQEAHNACGFVQFQCHHFIRGKLYKCGPVGLFPEFDLQHNFDISEEDRKLLHNYHPLSVHEFAQRGKEFIDGIDDVIPQCKFCPAHTGDNTNEKISATNKKKDSISSFPD